MTMAEEKDRGAVGGWVGVWSITMISPTYSPRVRPFRECKTFVLMAMLELHDF